MLPTIWQIFAQHCDFQIVKHIIFNFNQNTNLRKYNNYELRVIRERKSLLVWIWSTCQAGFCWDSDLFGTPKHLFLSLPVPSDRLGANVKMSSTPFFPQKSFAKKFSKIQGQIWNNPLSNLNLAWEICEAFFCWLFFTYSYSAFGLSLLIAQLSVKWNDTQRPKI